MADRPDDDDFEQPQEAAAIDALVLQLDAYEGPIDVLLDQARQQKVDLTQISILALADQYLAFVERARDLELELAADYLVMAAWLAFLKSRLLLPDQTQDEEPTGAELAEALTFQLRRLEAMRASGKRLFQRQKLGQEVFARGMPEPLRPVRRSVFDASLYDLLKAYAEHRRRQQTTGAELRIEASRLYSMDDAMRRLSTLLGNTVGWAMLTYFLPKQTGRGLMARSAVASTFAASLELARQGRITLRQDGPFAPLYLRQQDDPRHDADADG